MCLRLTRRHSDSRPFLFNIVRLYPIIVVTLKRSNKVPKHLRDHGKD